MRWLPIIIFALVLAAWPLTRWYTSFGVDFEQNDGPAVHCHYYRLRWPGDGSMMIGRIDEERARDRKPGEGVDLGGLFFHPPVKLVYGSIWNRLGFWAVNYDRDRDAGPCPISPLAERAWVIGFPYWLLVLAVAVPVAVQLFRRRVRRNVDGLLSESSHFAQR